MGAACILPPFFIDYPMTYKADWPTPQRPLPSHQRHAPQRDAEAAKRVIGLESGSIGSEGAK